MFFNQWSDLLRILVVGSLAYAGLIFFLRISGKRTLSKMNAFDLIVTVSFGSTLATVLLSKDVSLAEGLVALGLLCLLQFVVAFLSVRSSTFQGLIKSEPTMLFYRGGFIETAMRRERVARDEALAAVRAQGFGGLEKVHAIVLETDGSFSIISNLDEDENAALRHVYKEPG